MGRSVISVCALAGTTLGSLIPALWGGSSFSLASIVLGIAGAIAGVWLGARLSRLA
jgi:hypothetical protein